MTIPVVLTAHVDSPVDLRQLLGRDDPAALPWAAEKAAFLALVAELDEADPFTQYLLRTGIGTEVAPLVNGLIPSQYVPVQPLATTWPVDVPADLTGLTAAVRGDVAVVADNDPGTPGSQPATYILKQLPPTTAANWQLLPSPASVLTVDGQSGVVVLPVDEPADTGSKRTLGTGALQAAPGNHDHDGVYLKLDATNLTTTAARDALKTALGRLSMWEGIELWGFGHSLFNLGGSTQAARFLDRLARRLGTVGRVSADAFDLGVIPASILGRVPLNQNHAVEFSVNAGAYSSPASIGPRLRRVPPSNNLDYGAGPLAAERTDLIEGCTNHSRPSFKAGPIVGVLLNKWVPGTRGLVVACLAANNILAYSDDPDSLDAFGNVLRTALRFLRAEPANGTKVGIHDFNADGAGGGVAPGWASAVASGTYNGAVLSTSAVGATCDFTVTGDEVIVGTLQRDAGGVGGLLEITNGGGTTVYVPQFETVGGFAASSEQQKWYTRTHRITGLGSGDHPIRVRKADAVAGLGVSVDCWWTCTTTPPQVLIVKEHQFGTDPDGWAAHMDVIDTVAAEAEFASYVATVDANAGWDAATMAWDSGAHLGDRGHAHYADVIEQALASLAWREGSHRLHS